MKLSNHVLERKELNIFPRCGGEMKVAKNPFFFFGGVLPSGEWSRSIDIVV